MVTLVLQNAVEVTHLAKSFGANLVFRDASVAFRYGGVSALVGANGSGKTLLLNIISGLDHPDRGTVKINGVDITHFSPHHVARLGVGRTFQYPNIPPTLTVSQYFLLARRLSLPGLFLARPAAYPNVIEDLSRFALEDSLDQSIGQLSFGQQKIVEIIAGLLAPCSVILMDEPTAGLSMAAKRQIASLIKDWIKPDRAVIMTEHDMEFLSETASHVAVVEDGAIGVR